MLAANGKFLKKIQLGDFKMWEKIKDYDILGWVEDVLIVLIIVAFILICKWIYAGFPNG